MYEQAVARYHELLAEGHAAATQDALACASRERRLTFLGRPLCGVLRPYFIGNETLADVTRAAEAVVCGLNTLTRLLLRDPGLRRELALPAEADAWMDLDSAEPKEVVARLDGFLTPDGVRFIEYNPRPASLFEHAQMPGVFAALPIMRELARAFDLEAVPFEDAFVEALVELRRRFAEQGPATLTVVAEISDAVDREFRAEAQSLGSLLRRAEWRVSLCSPKALTCRDGRVFESGREVGPVFVANWERLRRRLPRAHPFWQAARDGHVFLVNSHASTLLRGNKATFALLSDPRFARHHEPQVAEALARHVPWTRLVRRGPVEWQGREWDLVELLQAQRGDWVLKPTDAYGGQGVALGWACDRARWAAAVERALASPYVVQERVPEGREPFPVWDRGGWTVGEHLTDFNVYVWNARRARGCMARVSRGPLMNMTAGAGTTAPVFAVRARPTARGDAPL
jgi:hypothetical protein